MTDKDLYDIYLRAYNMHPKHSGGSKHGAGLRAVADAARTPAPEAKAIELLRKVYKSWALHGIAPELEGEIEALLNGITPQNRSTPE